VDTITIFFIGATAITLLFFVMFIDKKNHAELAKQLKLENQIIKTNAQEQARLVKSATIKALK